MSSPAPVTQTVPDQRDPQLQTLLEQSAIVNPDMGLSLIERAYDFSKRGHTGQVRKSGRPHLDHCLEVARTLISLHLDSVTVAAGLLHDVVEDAGVTIAQLEAEFGPEVSILVDGVTKITSLTFQSREERQAEYFRKMLLSMAKDIRVIIIKLADRLHNMRTLEYLDPADIQRIALETREIYAPLAHRFGMAKIKAELEDLSLKYLDPTAYRDLATQVADKQEIRERQIDDIRNPLMQALKDAGITATVTGRVKHFYSIYTKMERRSKSFEDLYDLLAIRVITETVKDCYHALGIIHTMYTPVFDRFKDFIAKPKINMYQSLHTTVIDPHGKMVEIQIRTKEMDRTAEVGIAAHWLYKEGRERPDEFDRRMAWLRQALDWQSEMNDPKEFMQFLRMDLYEDEIFVFTPKGDLKALPKEASALDFAFAIHTDIGLHCTGAKVNGKIVPLASRLQSGDTVEILTSPHQAPNHRWLDMVKTSKAATKIRAWLKQATYEQSVELGKEMLEREFKRLKLKKKPGEELVAIAQSYGLPDVDHLYAAIGQGDIAPAQVGQKLHPPDRPPDAPTEESMLAKFVDRVRKSTDGVKVRGVDNLMLRFAQCCQPVPGDSIVGFVTRGRGVTIHRSDCPNGMLDPARRLPVAWDVDKHQSFLVGLNVFAHDRPGLLSEITRAITDAESNITHATMNTGDRLAEGTFTIEVSHVSQLETIIKRIRRIKGVLRVERKAGIEEHTDDGV